MRMISLVGVFAVLTAPTIALVAEAASPLTKVGQCANTTIKLIGGRLEGAPDSGTTVVFTNGILLVSYDIVAPAKASRLGDRANVCLKSVPQNCPPGDDRGKVYTVTNLRTKQSFTMPDSQHLCGGA